MKNKKLFKLCGLNPNLENFETIDTKTLKLDIKHRFVDVSNEYCKKYIDKLHYNCQNMENNLSSCRKRIVCFTPVRKTHKALTTETTKQKFEGIVQCIPYSNKQLIETPIVFDDSIEDSINQCENQKSILNNYIESQHLSLTKEVVVPSLRDFQTDRKLFGNPKIKNCMRDIRKISVKHEHEGIMRRNKLLIEHILYQRIKDRCNLLSACVDNSKI